MVLRHFDRSWHWCVCVHLGAWLSVLHACKLTVSPSRYISDVYTLYTRIDTADVSAKFLPSSKNHLAGFLFDRSTGPCYCHHPDVCLLSVTIVDYGQTTWRIELILDTDLHLAKCYHALGLGVVPSPVQWGIRWFKIWDVGRSRPTSTNRNDIVYSLQWLSMAPRLCNVVRGGPPNG